MMCHVWANCILDLLEDALVLYNTHADKLLCSPVLVENVVGVLAELLHIRANEHLPQFDEVTVIFIVDLHNAPRVRATAYFTSIRSLDKVVRADHGKWNLAGDFFSLGESLFVLVLVRWGLEDMDIVVSNVGEDLAAAIGQQP